MYNGLANGFSAPLITRAFYIKTETTHRYTFNKGDSVYLNDAPPCGSGRVEYYIHTKLIMFYNYTKLIIASRQCKRLSFNEELN